MKQRKGFTLIELLVVIAIIAILAAILFPVFSKAREKARQTSCSSNEKQLSLAMMQYLQDYDEKFPQGIDENDATNSFAAWVVNIYSYVKAGAVFTCPDDSTNPFSGDFSLSYASNMNLGTQPGKADQGSVAVSLLASPAKTVLLCEADGDPYGSTNYPVTGNVQSLATNGADNVYALCLGNGYGLGQGAPTVFLDTGIFGNITTTAGTWPFRQNARHTDGSNYSFADGHVKWLRSGAVSAGADNTTGTPTDCGTVGSSGNPYNMAAATGASTCSYGAVAATFSLH